MMGAEENLRYLLVDVGAGTMDILYFESGSNLHYKAVVRSPVQLVSERAAQLPGNLLVTGCEMGGGALSQVLRERAQTSDVIMTPAAAMTISHDLDRVRSWGIRILTDERVGEIHAAGAYSEISLTDLPIGLLEQVVTGFGVPFEFDVVGVCAQDHGVPPRNISHLEYRHTHFKKSLNKYPYPDTLLYEATEVPKIFNRLTSMARSARELPAREIYVMDSGFAAILGASMDTGAWNKENILLLDIATSHTVGAALTGKELAGFFEYHTRDISLEKIELLLRDLADGTLDHDRILLEGGHGAYTRKGFGFGNVQAVIATGPKRRMLESSRLPITFGAPMGDNMMTGNVGLLEAIRRRKHLPLITYT